MAINISADPNQVQIPNEIGVGNAQVLPQPNLSYIDQQNALADRERFRFKQAQRAHLQKEQDKIASTLDIEGKGKTFPADDPFIMDRTKKVTDWLYDQGNATKVIKGDPEATLQWNNMKRDYALTVNDSVQKNLAYNAKLKEIGHNGGYGGYYSGAQEEMERHLKPLTPEQIKNGERPGVLDESKISERVPTGSIEKQIRETLGKPVTAGTTVVNEDKSSDHYLSEGYPAAKVKEAIAQTLSTNPRILKDESENLNDKWDKLTPEQQEKYTMKDENGKPIPGRAGHDVFKYAEDQHAPHLTGVIKTDNTHKNAPASEVAENRAKITVQHNVYDNGKQDLDFNTIDKGKRVDNAPLSFEIRDPATGEVTQSFKGVPGTVHIDANNPTGNYMDLKVDNPDYKKTETVEDPATGVKKKQPVNPATFDKAYTVEKIPLSDAQAPILQKYGIDVVDVASGNKPEGVKYNRTDVKGTEISKKATGNLPLKAGQGNSMGRIKVTTQAQYDALPKGTKYVDSDGKNATK